MLKKSLKLISVILSLTLLLAVSAQAASIADTWPERDLTVLIPWTAGGGMDQTARLIWGAIEEEIHADPAMRNVTINMTNMVGGNGWISWIEMFNSDPNYTFSMGNNPALITSYMNPSSNIHYTIDDFSFLFNVVSDVNCVAIGAGQTKFGHTIEEYIEWAKANPGSTIGSSGIGSDRHIMIIKLMQAMGIEFDIPHFAGSAPMFPEVLGSHLDAGMLSVSEFAPRHNEGDAVILCVFSKERSPWLPDVRTFEEVFGIPLYGAADRGQHGAAALDPGVRNKIIELAKRATAKPEFHEKAFKAGLAINMIYGDEQTARFVESVKFIDSLMEFFGWR